MFAFRQITQAILPRLSLRQMMADWALIADGLREAPRKREMQLERFTTS